MGQAFEVLTGRVTNAGAALTAVTLATGDSLAIRSADMANPVWLENLWTFGAAASVIQVRSPRMHDNVQGIRVTSLAATPQPLLPDEVDERLYPQDVLNVAMTGGAAETDMASLLVYYSDLPGIAARLGSWPDVAGRVEHFLTVELALTTGGTVGDYGGGVPVNTTFDLLKANTDYAILGYLTNVAVATVGIRSPDFGNLRVGGPGTTQRIDTRDWFVQLSADEGRPHIPIFNSANKGSTIVDLVHNAAGTAVTVDLICAQLRG